MIETPHLKLRRCRSSDVDAVFAYRSLPEVAEHLRARPWTRAKTLSELALYEAGTFEKQGDELVLLAETRDTHTVAGEVGLFWRIAPVQIAEVGYVFNPGFGGRGLAGEAVSATVRWALTERGFQVVIATTDAANTRSRALCERTGMTLVATSTSTDGRNVAENTYAISHAPVDAPRLVELLTTAEASV